MEADQQSTEYNRPAQTLPYLSVLPMTEQYLDLSTLERVQKGLADYLLEQLLHTETDIVVHIPLGIQQNTPTQQINQLKALQRSFKDFRQQAQGLSIGFPLLLLQDDELGCPVSAPLFIWKIVLKEVTDSNMDWTITPLNNNQGYLNPLIKNYLEARFSFLWEEAIGLIDTVDQISIQQTLKQLKELGVLPIDPQPILVPSPRLDQATLNSCSYSLLLGQFEPITIQENKKLPKHLQNKQLRKWLHCLPGLVTNHQQRQWLKTVFEGHHAVVEGGSNTGKTHAIAAALPSVLVNQGSVLIVSPTPSTFDDLYHYLERMHLLNVGVLSLQDEVMDKERLIAYLERLPKHSRSISSFDEVTYSQELDSYWEIQQELVMAHQSLHQPLLNGWNWLELLGNGLLEHKQHHRQLLGRFLNPNDFEFSTQEYNYLKKDLQQHYPLFRPLDALKHPLNALNGRFFTDNSSLTKTQEKVLQLIELYKHKSQLLYDSYLIFIGEYADSLHLSYRNFATRIEQQVNKIERQIALYKKLYGEAFDKQSSFQDAKLKVLSLFSRKYQAIRAAKIQLSHNYQQLKEEYIQHNYLQEPFPDSKEELHLTDVAVKLEKLRQTLKNWRTQVPQLVQKTTTELQTDSTLPKSFQTRLNSLEKKYNALIKAINADQLFLRPLESNVSLLKDKETFLLKLLLQLQKLEQHKEKLEIYYHWRRSWRGLPQNSQKIVQALVKARAKDWLTYFKSWYFHQILLQHYSHNLPTKANHETLPILELQEHLTKLQSQLYQKAAIATKIRQQEQIKRIKREKDLTLTKARKIFKNKKIKDILDWIGLDHLDQVFPIVLASPEMAAQLVDKQQVATFDWVVLDNAHKLPQQLGLQLSQLGNQQVVFGQPETESIPHLENNTLTWMLKQKDRKQQHFTRVHAQNSTPTSSPKGAIAPHKHTFYKVLSQKLAPYIDIHRLQFQVPIEGVTVDLLVSSIQNNCKDLIVVIDGGLLNQEVYDFQLASQRQHILQQQKYTVYYLWSVDWWKDEINALEKLLTQILAVDKQAAPLDGKPRVEEDE